jgi:hypothetical protein
LFSAQHYNAVAKIFRENFPLDSYNYAQRAQHQIERGTLVNLALEFTKYFKKDNPSFDPVKFLDHCSPDVDAYPLSELWEDE